MKYLLWSKKGESGKKWSSLARIGWHNTETGAVNLRWDVLWPGYMQWYAPYGNIRWHSVGQTYERHGEPEESGCLRENASTWHDGHAYRLTSSSEVYIVDVSGVSYIWTAAAEEEKKRGVGENEDKNKEKEWKRKG